MMELNDLARSEMLALVGLLEYVAMGDRVLSDEEEEELRRIMAEIGVERYEELIDEFDAEYADETDFRSLLESVKRPEARELIYGAVWSADSVNVLLSEPSELLAWLREEWNLDVRSEPDSPAV